jgi:ribosomal protein S18 acetylase RimI-like enzyme
MEYRDALIKAYKGNPCQVLPNAFWKTESQINHLQVAYRIETGSISQLAAWDLNQLVVFWSRERDRIPDFPIPLESLSLVLIHQDHIDQFPTDQFSDKKAYFRLICKPQGEGDKGSVSGDFIFQGVDLRKEISDVAGFIDTCYPNIKPTDETVRGWLSHPTFDSELWFWVLDKENKNPVGLGIAEVDEGINEGSIEWVQVHPAFRGRGIGELMVKELIVRLSGKVEFITVAGEVGNETNPEALYRRCGFQGDDIWWMLTKVNE